jgi:hypothetical protein
LIRFVVEATTAVKRRKKTKGKKSRSLTIRPRASLRDGSRGRPVAKTLRSAPRIAAAAAAVAAVAAVFAVMEGYVRTDRPASGAGRVTLVDPPGWVGEDLRQRVVDAAVSAQPVSLSEKAFSIQQNIESSVPWLTAVKVQTAHDGVIVAGVWRRPLATIRTGSRIFYVDADRVVLDYVPVPSLPVAAVTGLAPYPVPQTGAVLEAEDLAAAVELLAGFARMDALVTADKPLLDEIDNIDMSNFNGRMGLHEPHIVLYAKDKTRIIWGAELGCWQRYLEAPDEDKLARLYNYYKQFGSLLDGVKYIDLRSPQGSVKQPIDRY